MLLDMLLLSRSAGSDIEVCISVRLHRTHGQGEIDRGAATVLLPDNFLLLEGTEPFKPPARIYTVAFYEEYIIPALTTWRKLE
jgi:hypothetical protein